MRKSKSKMSKSKSKMRKFKSKMSKSKSKMRKSKSKMRKSKSKMRKSYKGGAQQLTDLLPRYLVDEQAEKRKRRKEKEEKAKKEWEVWHTNMGSFVNSIINYKWGDVLLQDDSQLNLPESTPPKDVKDSLHRQWYVWKYYVFFDDIERQILGIEDHNHPRSKKICCNPTPTRPHAHPGIEIKKAQESHVIGLKTKQ
jgi:hypothetical protein